MEKDFIEITMNSPEIDLWNETKHIVDHNDEDIYNIEVFDLKMNCKGQYSSETSESSDTVNVDDNSDTENMDDNPKISQDSDNKDDQDTTENQETSKTNKKFAKMDTFTIYLPNTAEAKIDSIVNDFTVETGSFFLTKRKFNNQLWEFNSMHCFIDSMKDAGKKTANYNEEEKEGYVKSFTAQWCKDTIFLVFYFVRFINDVDSYNSVKESAINILNKHLSIKQNLKNYEQIIPRFLIPPTWQTKQLDMLFFISGKEVGEMIFNYLEKIYNS